MGLPEKMGSLPPLCGSSMRSRFTVEFDRPLNEDVQMEPHRLPRGALARPPPGPFLLRNPPALPLRGAWAFQGRDTEGREDMMMMCRSGQVRPRHVACARVRGSPSGPARATLSIRAFSRYYVYGLEEPPPSRPWRVLQAYGEAARGPRSATW